RAGGGGARLRLRDSPPACRALAHELRPDALPAPDPGEQLLLVRGHRAARRRLRVRDAAGRAHARQPRRALVRRAAPEPAQGLLHRRGGGAGAARARTRDDAARAAADVRAVRGLDLARGVRGASRCEGVRRRGAGMTRAEWTRLGGFSAGVVLLHLLGFGLFLYYLPRNPALTGLATLAYTFGLRHAFDADHIAAIDNTTRKLLQDGERPLGTGFFFSLGHSSVVFGLTAGLAIAAKSVNSQIPALQKYGSTVGASVSGAFLLVIGALNLLVLLEVVGVFRRMKRGTFHEEDLDSALVKQGFLSRVLLKRLGSKIDA